MIETQRAQLFASLAHTLEGYEPNSIDVDHIEKWLKQFNFDEAVQPVILQELERIFKRTYFSRIRTKVCLRRFIMQEIFGDNQPDELIPSISFLKLQQKGDSQNEMLTIADEILKEEYHCSINDCGENAHTFIYFDDGINTGNRLRYDFTEGNNAPAWLVKNAPHNCKVMIYALATHSAGLAYAKKYLLGEAQKKNIEIKIYSCLQLDTFKNAHSSMNFIWPKFDEGYNDPSITACVDRLEIERRQQSFDRYPLYRENEIENEQFFSSPQARHIVEQSFLKVGAYIKMQSPNLSSSIRPLGFEKKITLGLGTFFATYRNIPNNCPVALWTSTPTWNPLFRRKTNRNTETQRIFDSLPEVWEDI